MTFARTPSGLKNYSNFYNSEVIVYIEGRILPQSDLQVEDEDKVFDVIFYTALFKVFSPFNKIKIKIVGCKKNVLDYHDLILKKNIDKSYAIIDRDYDGVLFTRIATSKLIVTHGYSWENDFWSPKLCDEIIDAISLDYQQASDIVKKKCSRSLSRLCIINRANIISQYFGSSLFPINKKGGANGFKYDVTSKFPMSFKEVKRILAKLPNGAKVDLNKENLLNATNMKHNNLIQGHFYEYMMLHIMSCAYKISSGVTHNMSDFNMIKNMAFNKFKLKPDFYLEPSTLQHYENEFKKLI